MLETINFDEKDNSVDGLRYKEVAGQRQNAQNIDAKAPSEVPLPYAFSLLYEDATLVIATVDVDD
jgi:hypothetical protein